MDELDAGVGRYEHGPLEVEICGDWAYVVTPLYTVDMPDGTKIKAKLVNLLLSARGPPLESHKLVLIIFRRFSVNRLASGIYLYSQQLHCSLQLQPLIKTFFKVGFG